jgi:hypothetical protein
VLQKSPRRGCRIAIRNNRIEAIGLLNQCCALVPDLESNLARSDAQNRFATESLNEQTSVAAAGRPVLWPIADMRRTIASLHFDETWPDGLGEPLRRRAWRKEAEILAIAAHKINESRVVDGITRSVFPFDFFVIRPVGIRRRADPIRIAGETAGNIGIESS